MAVEVFEGVKVADFTWSGAGPLAIKYLAIHGATVIRIESSLAPDPMRTAEPFCEGIHDVDHCGYFAYMNCNLYSIALNLKQPKGVDVAKKLVAWADIVAESYTAGTMERLGLGYEDLRKIKPDIIMLRSSGQGHYGRHAAHPGYGHQMIGLSGFCHLTGWADQGPQTLGVAYTDYVSARLGAVALIAALHYRRKTGKGQLLDLSQLEASMHFLAPLILDYSANGREASRTGNSHPYAAPHGVYRCRGNERWCAIAIFNDKEWESLCEVIGNPPWANNPRFASLLVRKENEEELNRLVQEWTINFTAEEVMGLMQSAGIPAGVVQTSEDCFRDPQLKHRDNFWILNHREIKAYPHMGQPFKLSKTPAQPHMPSPCLGQHTEFVCKELLDMPEKEFAELLTAGVFI